MIVGMLLKLQPTFVHGAKNPKKTANACFEAGASMLISARTHCCCAKHLRVNE